MQSMHDFVSKHGIKLSCKRTSSNPHMEDSRSMDHWRCTLSRPGGKRMTTVFSMGRGHGGRAPNAAQVLNALALDANTVKSYDFEDWCEDFGYDSDSAKARKMFKACEKTAQKLYEFLGVAGLDELCWSTESL